MDKYVYNKSFMWYCSLCPVTRWSHSGALILLNIYVNHHHSPRRDDPHTHTRCCNIYCVLIKKSVSFLKNKHDVIYNHSSRESSTTFTHKNNDINYVFVQIYTNRVIGWTLLQLIAFVIIKMKPCDIILLLFSVIASLMCDRCHGDETEYHPEYIECPHKTNSDIYSDNYWVGHQIKDHLGGHHLVTLDNGVAASPWNFFY